MQTTNNVARASPQPPRSSIDPLRLLSKISRNGDLMNECRPSQSLPGSPRKIRVAANLPDVGSDSPDLRYKVLTQRRPRPGSSTHNTPRKLPGGRNGIPRHLENQSYGSKKSGLVAPNLSSNGCGTYIESNQDNKLFDDINDPPPPILGHNGIHFSNSRSDNKNSDTGYESDKSNSDINIKNTKNKLNLQFAPDKINRPSDDFDSDSLNDEEEKITREINGNLKKDLSKESFNGNFNSNHKSQFLLDPKDDDDTSKSEESEISVLELSAFINYKENGDRQLAEATRHSSASEISDQSSDNHLSESNYIDSGNILVIGNTHTTNHSI